MEWLETTTLWQGADAAWDWLREGLLAFLDAVRHDLTTKGKALEAFRNLLLGLGVFGALYGVFLALRRTQTDRKRQVSDSYAKAVELLGHERRSIRVGALFALERIMLENRELHRQVVETICGYARERSGMERRALSAGSAYELIEESESILVGDDPVVHAIVSDDVSAVVIIVARRPWRREGGWRLCRKGWRLRWEWWRWPDAAPNLDGVRAPAVMLPANGDLAGVSMLQADLRRARLSHTNLSEAALSDANLSHALLEKTALGLGPIKGIPLSAAI